MGVETSLVMVTLTPTLAPVKGEGIYFMTQ